MRLTVHPSPLPRCIIIEGPTAVGKGTLIRRLIADEPWRMVRHFGRPPVPGNVRDIEAWYAEAAMPPVPAILDRWIDSNEVYSQVMGNQERLSVSARLKLEAHLVAMYALSVSAVTLIAGPKALRQRHKARGSKPSSDPFVSNFHGISRGYAYTRLHRIPHSFIRTDQLSPDQVYERARHLLETKQR